MQVQERQTQVCRCVIKPLTRWPVR